jgi:hypothetical protein
MEKVLETFEELFYKEYKAEYSVWKKGRPAKIAQTKALRKAKASAK